MVEKEIGFILLRHINSKKTDKYWIHCYDCIRKFYPENKILIIDDNSNDNFVTKDKKLYKTTIIHSEYPQRGELLPYYYYLHNKLFDTAVILHDGCFITKYTDFRVNKYKMLWNFPLCRSSRVYAAGIEMIKIFNDSELSKFYENKTIWKGNFGAMSIITHDYLKEINKKYDISKLLGCITTRFHRQIFERIWACLLQKNDTGGPKTLLGNIHTYCKWGFGWDEKENWQHLPIIRIWTGR